MKLAAALMSAAFLAACADKPAVTPTVDTSGTGAATATGPVPGSQEDLVAKGIDRVYFDYNRSSLSSEAHSTLDQQSAFLTQYAQDNVQIAGNCDERGTEEYNIALGQRRANAARDYLVAKGVAGSRISTISYGKDRPIATGSDEEAYRQNRNATTSVR